jgi:hypothetical protein
VGASVRGRRKTRDKNSKQTQNEDNKQMGRRKKEAEESETLPQTNNNDKKKKKKKKERESKPKNKTHAQKRWERATLKALGFFPAPERAINSSQKWSQLKLLLPLRLTKLA